MTNKENKKVYDEKGISTFRFLLFNGTEERI